MSPLQALELVRGFAAAVQESSPDAQREVVERVFTRIAIPEMRLSTWTYTRYTPRLSGGIYDPNRTSFELQLNSDLAILLDQHTVGERLADGPRTLNGRLANAGPSGCEQAN
jgi:hypothetical protein